jgi:anaerobic ribonucleoside-triphosphate reductase activating protein
MKQLSHQFLSRPDAVNVAHMVECCHVLGPGERFVIWVQGCPLRCPDCHNPDFLPFRDATWINVRQLVEQLLNTKNIEGLTLVGGEPFAQAGAIASLCKQIRSAGLSIMVYSGFTFSELTSGLLSDAELLLDETDLLMEGPYLKDFPTQKPWRGSDNQNLITLSDRYVDRIKAWNQPLGQAFEMRFTSDGTLEILGIPPADLSRDLSKAAVSHQ